MSVNHDTLGSYMPSQVKLTPAPQPLKNQSVGLTSTIISRPILRFKAPMGGGYILNEKMRQNLPYFSTKIWSMMPLECGSKIWLA